MSVEPERGMPTMNTGRSSPVPAGLGSDRRARSSASAVKREMTLSYFAANAERSRRADIAFSPFAASYCRIASA